VGVEAVETPTQEEEDVWGSHVIGQPFFFLVLPSLFLKLYYARFVLSNKGVIQGFRTQNHDPKKPKPTLPKALTSTTNSLDTTHGLTSSST
jgi:hypothetical protein